LVAGGALRPEQDSAHQPSGGGGHLFDENWTPSMCHVPPGPENSTAGNWPSWRRPGPRPPRPRIRRGGQRRRRQRQQRRLLRGGRGRGGGRGGGWCHRGRGWWQRWGGARGGDGAGQRGRWPVPHSQTSKLLATRSPFFPPSLVDLYCSLESPTLPSKADHRHGHCHRHKSRLWRNHRP